MITTVIETLPPVPFILGHEHSLPYPPLPTDVSTHFTAVAPSQRSAFLVFQQKLADLGLDEFPYRAQVKPSQALSGLDVANDKELLTKWKDSPWHKDCFWTEDFQALQARLFKLKKPLTLPVLYQAFTSLNLCGQEVHREDFLSY